MDKQKAVEFVVWGEYHNWPYKLQYKAHDW